MNLLKNCEVQKMSIRNNKTDRITEAFEKRKKKYQKALITFVTAGDPDIMTTERLIYAMIEEGADLVELGIPYSDPIAEGPVIQAANERALIHGIRMTHVFSLVKRIRKRTEVPIVLLLYVNVILQYGPDTFFSACRESGIDGVIVPDLPYEEREEIEPYAIEHGVSFIRMVSPVSEHRIRQITEGSTGFLYCVSSLGVTGTRSAFQTDFEKFFETINASCKIPTALGFGISNSQQVKEIKKYSDGVIVGSAMVKTISEAIDNDDAVMRASLFTRELRMALDCSNE